MRLIPKNWHNETEKGLKFIHSTFTLMELFTISGFTLVERVVNGSLWLAHESVSIIDAIFGSTETSQALATLIMLIDREFYNHSSENKDSFIPKLTKALTAYMFLQLVTDDPPPTEMAKKLKLDNYYKGGARGRGITYPTRFLITNESSESESLSEKQLDFDHDHDHNSKGLTLCSQNCSLSTNYHDHFDVQSLQCKAFLIQRFMKYSSASYGLSFMKWFGIGLDRWHDLLNHSPSATIQFQLHLELTEDCIIYSSPLSQGEIVHFVCIDHRLKTVVVTCRGTLGLSDLITDMVCDYEPHKTNYCEFFTHSGALKCAKKLSQRNSPLLSAVRKAMEEYDNYSLTLCGHSLGGGVASLLSVLWSKKVASNLFLTSEESGLPPNRHIHCYTYGAMGTFDLDGGVQYTQGLVTSIVYNMDCIPYISLGLIRDFKNISDSLSYEPKLVRTILKRVFWFKSTNWSGHYSKEEIYCAEEIIEEQIIQEETHSLDPYPWFLSLIKTMRADMQSEKLYPPGNVYLIKPSEMDGINKRRTTELHRVSNIEDYFSEIKFGSSMISDHNPKNYESAIESLVLSCE
jgi:hypothetical protein